ncbi:MAG: VOC family protein [Candidatus Promineifilaceae bacterium]
MTTIKGVAEAALYTNNIHKATAFYTEVLGLPLTAAFGDSRFLQTGPNSTLILFQLDTLQTRKSIIPAHGTVGAGHVALAIDHDQYEAWKARLITHHVAIEHEQTWPAGTRSIYFRDPDNNSLELIESNHYPQTWEKLQQNTDC